MNSIFRSLRGAAGGRLNKNRAEAIKTGHIALVLPATDPDPSHPGFFGTRALRLSEDIPNPSRTFSLLYGDWSGAGLSGTEGHGQAQGTLDLECPDDGMYAMLFQVRGGAVRCGTVDGKNVFRGAGGVVRWKREGEGGGGGRGRRAHPG